MPREHTPSRLGLSQLRNDVRIQQVRHD
jgi:hypothetical protein